MQIYNNTQIVDWKASNETAFIDFSGSVLEYVYPVRSEKELKDLLSRKIQEQQRFQEIRNKLGFGKIICRFFFRNYKPNLELQKQLIDFQEGIFDELGVQMISNRFNTFQKVYEHAVTKSIPITTFVDIALSRKALNVVCDFLVENDVANARWKCRKVDSYLQHYSLVSSKMQQAGIEYYLVACGKKCSIKESDFNDIAVPIVARGYFGFKGCCFDYRFQPKPKKDKKLFFPKTMPQFDTGSYKWIEVRNKGFRKSRTQDVENIGKAGVSDADIRKRDSVNRLFKHLKKKSRSK